MDLYRAIQTKKSLRSMMRSILIFTVIVLSVLAVQAASQTPSPAVTHHEANFESERKQADELFLAQKPLDALPLYEDLCRQDPTVALFAERHGAGLLAKEATLSDPAERLKVHRQAIQELKRAQALGDNSAYVRAVLYADSKTFVGAVIAGIPLTVGYTHQGKSEAQAVFRVRLFQLSRPSPPTSCRLRQHLPDPLVPRPH
jgi:hypothetical protein